MFDIKTAHENFGRLDLVAITSMLSNIENNETQLLQFIKDPDNFLRSNLAAGSVSDRFHCHIVAEEKVYPSEIDSDAPSIVFNTEIKVKKQLQNDILAILGDDPPEKPDKPTPSPSPSPKPTPEPERPGCKGCGECAKVFIRFY